jgi:uncharacterized protein
VATTITETPGEKSATAERRTAAKRRFAFRPWLRALHRDIGYLAVGFTVIYAVSGLAVNHIADWDPSFVQVNRSHRIAPLKTSDTDAAARAVLAALAIDDKPRDIYRLSETALDIEFDKRTLHVDLERGLVNEEGQSPRPFLRLINWLHLNRGKKAWTYLADTYAVFLLFLAGSGLFMIPGKKGLLGRGAVFVGVGAIVPILYVVLAGGP